MLSYIRFFKLQLFITQFIKLRCFTQVIFHVDSLTSHVITIGRTVPEGRIGRLRLKCDGTRAETRFRLSAEGTSPFKPAGSSVQSTTGRRGLRISCSNTGYTMFRGSVKSTGYPLHSPASPSLPLPRVTVCHHISTGLCLVLRSCYTKEKYSPSAHTRFIVFDGYAAYL